ncbi:MAG: hypothetical protein FWD33_04345 [Alphaproteobacteria bacterium]|nr:hypothetical protein [Alphaproteobacteria bacterium]
MAAPAVIALRILPLLVKPLIWGSAIFGVAYYYAKSLAGQTPGEPFDLNLLTDLAGSDGCLFCPYVQNLIQAVGSVAGQVYTTFINHIWILLVLGFGIFAAKTAYDVLRESMNKTADVTDLGERTFDMAKWVDGLWKQAIRIIVVGVFLGALGGFGMNGAKIISEFTVKPILSIGTFISMKVANIPDSLCPYEDDQQQQNNENSIISPSALRPLMCMTGAMNAVALQGAHKGFSTMKDSNGNPILWLLGLALVALFAMYGLKIFFELMNIVFTVLFFIMFLPIIIASYAFNNVWGISKNVSDNMLNQVTNMAIAMVSISLRFTMFYTIMTFAFDSNPGSASGALWTFIVIGLFYYYVVEKKLQERFAKSSANLFFDFGAKVEGFLKGSLNWTTGVGKKLLGRFAK